MVNVAVAGGTSATLGRSIVEAVLSGNGGHRVIILTRTPDKQSPMKAVSKKYGANVVPVDYSSISSLATVFKEHDIQKVVSVLKPLDPKEFISHHANILAAAQEARVSGFIMSDWSMGPLSHAQVQVLEHKSQLHQMGQTHMRSAEVKGDWKVDCATIQNGMFMEYLAQGWKPSNHEDDKSRLDAGLVDEFMLEYIDIANNKLVVPCKENGTPSPISTTSIKDIGTYVAASLDLPQGKLVGQVSLESQRLPSLSWVAEFLKDTCNRNISLDTITPSQCDKIAAQQKHAFEKSMQEKGEFNLHAFIQGMAAEMTKVSCLGELGGGVLEMEEKTSLNSLCPEVKPTKVEDLLIKAWGANSH